ncbi:hypothetical protein IWW50_001266 [Coemansia erecta]|nr:hypothetical protein GGF43_000925 [Coemansia sp. RSA 2618]KAJ2828661.1 hypothetical protein IWW50_001266 [Coemansia erecta]
MQFATPWLPPSADSLVVQTTNCKSLTNLVRRREVLKIIQRDGIDIWSMEETWFDEPLAAAFKATIERAGLGTAFSAIWTPEATTEWWSAAEGLTEKQRKMRTRYRVQKGVTIFVSERIKHYVVAVNRFIPENDPLHQADTGTGLCVRLQMHGKEVDVLGLYIPGTNFVPDRQLRDSLLAWANLRIDAANAANRHVVVLGDFNLLADCSGLGVRIFQYKIFRGAKHANADWRSVPGRTFQDAFWWMHGTHDESGNRIDGTYPLKDHMRMDKLYHKLDFAMVSTQLAPNIVQCAKTMEPSRINEDHSSIRFELAGILDAQPIELPPVSEPIDFDSWECSHFAAPYVCEHCEYSTYKKDRFKNHAAVHNESLKRHKCDHCDKKFVTAGGLRTHERIHTGVRPFVCETCGKGYKQQAHYQQHVQRIHRNEVRQLHCGICWARFVIRSDLNQHLRQHKSTWTTDPSLRCVCGLHFKGPKYLERHYPYCAWDERRMEPTKTDPIDTEIGERMRELTRAFRENRGKYESNEGRTTAPECPVCHRPFASTKSRDQHVSKKICQKEADRVCGGSK